MKDFQVGLELTASLLLIVTEQMRCAKHDLLVRFYCLNLSSARNKSFLKYTCLHNPKNKIKATQNRGVAGGWGSKRMKTENEIHRNLVYSQSIVG